MWQAVPKKIFLLGTVFLTVFFVMAAQLFFGAFGVDPGVVDIVRLIGSIAFALEVVLVLVINWGWKRLWKKFPVLGEVIFPDLSGAWQGEFSWVDKDGVPGSKPANILIFQNWRSIKVSVETDEANSETLSSWIEKDADTGKFTLNYVYLHTPKEVTRAGNPPHRGTASLVFDTTNMEKARGAYYTERKTAGDISLLR